MEDIEINKDVKKKSGGKKCGNITNLSKNSIEIYLLKTHEEGINCKQWFTIQEFKKQFIIIE